MAKLATFEHTHSCHISPTHFGHCCNYFAAEDRHRGCRWHGQAAGCERPFWCGVSRPVGYRWVRLGVGLTDLGVPVQKASGCLVEPGNRRPGGIQRYAGLPEIDMGLRIGRNSRSESFRKGRFEMLDRLEATAELRMHGGPGDGGGPRDLVQAPRETEIDIERHASVSKLPYGSLKK